jgi:hypothetical protein
MTINTISNKAEEFETQLLAVFIAGSKAGWLF